MNCMEVNNMIKDELVAAQDTRTVAADLHARYIGARLSYFSLVCDHPRLGAITLDAWLTTASAAQLTRPLGRPCQRAACPASRSSPHTGKTRDEKAIRAIAIAA